MHTLAIILILCGLGSVAWGALSAFADGMSDLSVADSGGCTFVIGGVVAVVVGLAGLLI